ncbi:20243_t:CDS:1 [Funneliformis geosporum]|uniref:19146_t:CDS:1 n=1 Tax=Funneliformis geosporum TaxID=1117311 RepID=A0A9W4SL64_9GLOM|nr:19146_t:CDS:1 [Funneliformis geosporum]CAI2172592.1 20243_t:CDS:1 [Funneliformis geosporum]
MLHTNDIENRMNDLTLHNQDYNNNPKTIASLSIQTIIPELVEYILIYLPIPYTVSPVCRLFHEIVSKSSSFKRRWLRLWLHPRLPDAFLPKYSELCQAVKTKTPFYILVQIIDLQRLYNQPLASSFGGSVSKLFEEAFIHEEREKLITFLISRDLNIDKYIKDHASKDFERTEGGSEPERKLKKDYLSPLIIAAQTSRKFMRKLELTKTYFSDTDLAFAIVLYERLDVATVLSNHPQHTLDILEESVDRQYTEGIAWAFKHGVGEMQKQKPLYLRMCIEKADVESARKIIESGANINISPSAHTDDPTSYGSTSLLEFSIQCFFAYANEEGNKQARREMIELFLISGSDPNADDGRPLALCVTNHDYEMVRLLLNYGADVNCDDKLAIRIATDMGYKDMARMLYRISKPDEVSQFNPTISATSDVVKGMVKRMSMLGRGRRRNSEGDANHHHKRQGSSIYGHKKGASRG